MELVVRAITSKDNPITIEVPDNGTAADAVRVIAQTQGLDPASIRLVYHSKVLSASAPVIDLVTCGSSPIVFHGRKAPADMCQRKKRKKDAHGNKTGVAKNIV
jgi:hypothetical protein